MDSVLYVFYNVGRILKMICSIQVTVGGLSFSVASLFIYTLFVALIIAFLRHLSV